MWWRPVDVTALHAAPTRDSGGRHHRRPPLPKIASKVKATKKITSAIAPNRPSAITAIHRRCLIRGAIRARSARSVISAGWC